ncbi:non-ribosomal peptide synthetase [Catenulispora rubra]|uniref:non-ribosomal peptide synthetase n=1 Tax=Catenulispora rubra TaxID=280293 RepID=UPI0018925CB5|nr:non-ribosomal peptide synthetase [Catenulispora rubra]
MSEVWTGPASFGQERLWLATRLGSDETIYSLSAWIRLPDGADEAIVTAALAATAARHETLRTSLRLDGERLLQAVHPAAAVRLATVDLSGHDDRWQGIADADDADLRMPFRLDEAPLWRATLAYTDAEPVLIFAAHHTVFDGGSVHLLQAEIREQCLAAIEGRPAVLPELPIQYADYAAWQRDTVSGAKAQAEADFWRERLSGLPRVHSLPTDRPRAAGAGQPGADRQFTLPTGAAAAAAHLGSTRRASAFMVFFAAYTALLHRLSGADDIVVGVQVAGRELPELAPLIGMFVNALAVRIDASGDPTFAELVDRVRERTLESWEHQDLPIHHVAEALGIRPDADVQPLYQIGINDIGDVGLNRSNGVARNELTLEISEDNARLEYRTDLFDAATADRICERFTRLTVAALADPDTRLSRLPVADEAERALVLDEWNDTAVDWAETGYEFADANTVSEVIRRRMAASPQALAVVDGDVRLTYGELRERVEELARRLRAHGVGPERPVAVALPRSADLVVAFLATLRAGGAYVPLDPGYPLARLAMMLHDSGAEALITSRAHRDACPPGAARVVLVDEPRTAEHATAAENQNTDELRDQNPDHLAYVIYTSGSTGRPKGVMVAHRSLLNYVLWFNREYGIGADDRMLVSSSPSFDAFGIELYPVLAAGGTLVVAPPSGMLEPARLLAVAAEEKVTALALVPTTLRLLLERSELNECSSLRHVFCGGEQLTGDLAGALAARTSATLHNLYGPTEATIDVASQRADPEQAGAVPIGRPLANARLYVLAEDGEPTPIGVPGHLHAGGVPLARGYLSRPALTAEAFVPDPFGPPGSRLYRTGDLARWRADGTLEYLGRVDGQVKLNGLRIEPGEVEAVLRARPGVRDAVVLVRDGALVAYVAGEAEPARLRSDLRAALPAHLVPAAFVPVPVLPMTPNGKLDTAALPAPAAPGASGGTDRESAPPSTAAEELVAEGWTEVLGVTRVGVEDDFFDLGGNSLSAARFVAWLSAAVEADIPIHAVFQHPTVGDLAAEVEKLLAAEIDTLSDAEADRLLHGTDR